MAGSYSVCEGQGRSITRLNPYVFLRSFCNNMCWQHLSVVKIGGQKPPVRVDPFFGDQLVSQIIKKEYLLKTFLLVSGFLSLFLISGAAQISAQENETPSPGHVPPPPIALLDGAADVIDITSYFRPVDMNDIAPEFAQSATASPDAGEVAPDDKTEEAGEIKPLEELRKEAERAAAARAASWYGVYIKNTTDKPLERLFVISRDTFRDSAFASGVGAPLELQNLVIKTAQAGRSFVKGISLKTDVLLSVTMVIPPQETAKIALLLPKELKASALYLWRVDAYVRYVQDITTGQGVSLGLLTLMGILLISLWAFSRQSAFLLSGLASLTSALYLSLAFDYIVFAPEFFGYLHVYFAGAALALAGVFANRAVSAMLNVDAPDGYSSNLITAGLYVFLFSFLYCLIGLPWAMLVLRVLIFAGLALMLAALLKFLPEAERAAKLSVPGWLVLLLAYVLGLYLVLAPGSESNLITEWLVYALLVMGALMIDFSVIVQALDGSLRLRAYADSAPGEMMQTQELSQHRLVREGASFHQDTEYYEMGLAAAGEGLWYWNIPDDKLYLSPIVSEMLGVVEGPAASTQEAWYNRVHPNDQERYRESLKSYLLLGSATFTLPMRVRCDNGSYLALNLLGTCLHDERHKPQHCVGVIRHAPEALDAVDTVGQIPTPELEPVFAKAPDALAALPRRESFLNLAAQALAEISDGGENEQEGVESSVAVILMDIDRFKSFDEGLGQTRADELLVTIAERLAGVTEKNDISGRLGGDEFGIFIPNLKSSEEAEERTAAVKRAVEHPLAIAGLDLYPSVSIGIAVSDGTQTDAAQLLEEAEKALYQAKRAGGSRIVSYAQGMGRDNGDALNLESELRRALDQYEMEVYYQPVMDLRNGRIAGFEALLRWNHPERGLLGPDQFVGLAEHLGLIVRLGRFALSMTSLQLSQWQQFFPLERPLFASVNVSAKQLLGEELVSDVRQIMKTVSLYPGSLKLEVTENLLIENAEEAAQILSELKDLGAGIVLDDFGTGHSTLERLKSFPFDALKIDQSFVSGLEDDEQLLIMVRSAIDLAHDLGIEVVAEGVETEAVGRRLYDLGCTYAQGFVFGAPMTAMEAQAFIAHYWAE